MSPEPSAKELMALTGKRSLKEACKDILGKGPEIVAVKQDTVK